MNEHPTQSCDPSADSPRSVGGIVLCGGDSRRMGRDKSWLPFGDELLLQRLVRITSAAVSPVVVAARAEQELPPLPDNVRVVHDAVAGRGPLEGMAAGLEALTGRCEAAFVTSCDHPFLRPDVIEALTAALGEHRAIVPVDGNRWYSLTGVYRIDTLPLLAEMLASRQTAARSFAERCNARLVPVEEFRRVDPQLRFLINVNDERSLRRAIRSME